IRDIVAVHQLLARHLQINQIALLTGGSLGGQQALEWAIMQPSFIKRLVLIATNARHSAWGIAFNEAQRMAIESGGEEGIKAARAIAMLSYRNYQMYADTQTDDQDKIDNFKASSYQRYQGEKLAKRFDSQCYVVLSKAMDSHHVGRGRGSLESALSSIKAQTLIIGISTDILFPFQEQKFLSENIPKAHLSVIHSKYGHDGFLLEYEQITQVISERFPEFSISYKHSLSQ
ncbi:MAG: alpha/beta fold hydrolase, partial [Chitinophagales bacterium]|nr:alpha/beta fold hydrolase [Chitinophagales bacterium]